MTSNNFMNPIAPIGFNPYQRFSAIPQPIQQMQVPFQPVSIKIDIVPNEVNGMPNVKADVAPQPKDSRNESVVYDVPKTSIYDSKKEVNKAEDKAVDTKSAEQKVEDKKVEATMAQILAAQAGVQMPTASTQAQVVDVAKPEIKQDSKKEVKNNKPEIVAPEKMKTGIDLNGLISILTSPDYEEQADAMEAISEVTMYAPEKAGELLDAKVVDNLLDIMSKDTSKLEGKDKELAERNKEYAMYTTATLQKLYADEIKQVGNVDVPAVDLVGMAGILNNLKTNPNASVREAAVASLGYVTKPEYKNDLGQLMKEAANDIDVNVRAQANKQLGKVMSFNA